MPQKKKQNKKVKKPKTTRKPRAKREIKTIVQQAIPNYASEQNIGYQYNRDNVQFVPQHQQQQTRTDSLVGDLVSKLISKIENDGTQQTQQYTKEVQPINNDNTNSNGNTGNTSGNTQTVNIYPSSGQSTTTTPDTTDTKKTAIDAAAGTALSAATGISAGEAAGIAGGVGAGVLAIGGGIFAGRKKLGEAIKKTFGGNKSGGTATRSRLINDDFVRGTKQGTNTDLQAPKLTKGSKAGKYENITAELDPLDEGFYKESMADTRAKLDKIREQAKLNEQKRNLTTQSLSTQTTPKPSPRVTSTQTTPKPSPRATPTPSPRRSTTPSQVPQLNLRLDAPPGYIEPIAGVFRARMSGI
jgi:hypothetical protein